MSPSGKVGMLEPSVAVVERDAAVERLIDLYFGTGEAEAARLGMNLQSLAVPWHDVVVANDAFMGEAADAFQVFRRGAPGFFGIAGSTSEAAVVVGDETGEDAVGRIRIAGMSEAKFAGKTILQ